MRDADVLMHTKQPHDALGSLKECKCVDASVCDRNVCEGLGKLRRVAQSMARVRIP